MAGTLVFSFDFIWFHFFFFFSPLLHLSVDVVWWCLEDRRYVTRIVLVGWDGFSSPFLFPPPLSLSFTCVYVLYGAMCHSVVSQKKMRKIRQLNLRDFFFLFFLFSLSLLEKTKRKKLFFSFFLFLFLINFLCDILSSFHCDFISYHLTQDSKSQHLC